MDIAALKALLDLPGGHPVTGAYSDDAAAAAAQLNVKNVPQNVESVPGQDIFEAVTSGDYGGLTAYEREQFYGIIGMGPVQVNAPNTKAALLAMFGPGQTRDSLAALQTELVSQAAGLGFVRSGHILQARAN